MTNGDDNKKFFSELNGAAREINSEVEAEFAKAKPAVSEPVAEALEEVSPEDEGQLSIDVYQTPTEIIVEAPIAGVSEKDIDIDITNETVTVRGRRERERHIREEDYVYQECYWGRFSRSVVLPHEVDADAAEAVIKSGVLTIRLPKINRARAKKLKVKSE